MYQLVQKKIATFCSTYSVTTSFLNLEAILCYFSTYMGCQGLSLQTIIVYLVEICYMLISLGLPDPKEFTSMAHLRMVQSGIQHYISKQDSRELHITLPIALTILITLWDYWLPKSVESDRKMLWAVSVICFFDFLSRSYYSSKYFLIQS